MLETHKSQSLLFAKTVGHRFEGTDVLFVPFEEPSLENHFQPYQASGPTGVANNKIFIVLAVQHSRLVIIVHGASGPRYKLVDPPVVRGHLDVQTRLDDQLTCSPIKNHRVATRNTLKERV